MEKHLTDRARKVMQLANQEAQRFNHEYIGTEHILLGLVKEGSGVAANVLKNLDIDLRKIRLEVEKIVQSGPDMVTMGKLPQTPRAKKVIEYSIEEARNLNHNYVGTEHLLLGLLREQEGVAAQVLTNMGLKLEDVRGEVLNMLRTDMGPEESGAGSGERPARKPTLDSIGWDLTELARARKLGPVIGREAELAAAQLVLACRDRSSLLVLGEPGVGKTHFLESLAVLATTGPTPLQHYRLVAVNPAQLGLTPGQATLDFLNEAHRCDEIVLVLDDLALFVDPALCPGGRVVGNLIRATLARGVRGGIRCVGTTTPAYYEAALRGDDVFGACFQLLRLSPPSVEETLTILRRFARVWGGSREWEA